MYYSTGRYNSVMQVKTLLIQDIWDRYNLKYSF
jgi:hypothetical protein